MTVDYDDVRQAATRIAGRVRPVVVTPPDHENRQTSTLSGEVWLALEYLQFSGSFKARGAQNFLLSHLEDGVLPDVGIAIASGGNAGLACAWAARSAAVPATIFVPETAPPVKVARLRTFGADVRLVGTQYADALIASQEFAARTGALLSHAYDHPLIAAGAGTLMGEIRAATPGLDTVVVAVGGGGLFSGIAAVAAHHRIRVVAVEPEHCRAFRAALDAGHPVDVAVDSIAADALGARRVSAMAVTAAQTGDVRSVLVSDEQIISTRRHLWDTRRIAVEHGAATALAALQRFDEQPPAYVADPDERVAVVLCGANTDPTTL